MKSEVTWDKVQAIFEWDGALRDIFVQGTTVRNWQEVLDLMAASEYPLEFEFEGQVSPFLWKANEIFERRFRGEEAPALTVDKGVLELRCYFFEDDWIEFSIWPTAIDSLERFERLLRFMESVGLALKKPMSLTWENARGVESGAPPSFLIRFDPTSRSFLYDEAVLDALSSEA